MFLSFRRQAEKAALPCKLRKTTTKTTKLVICYQSNAWRRYSQILIWKCIFLLFVNTLFTQKGWFNGNGSSECRNLKKVPRERDNSMNVILQRPILRLSHNNSDIPRVKCWYISDLNSTHFSGEEEKRTWKRGQNLNALAKNDSRYVGKGGPKRAIVAKLHLLQVNLS